MDENDSSPSPGAADGAPGAPVPGFLRPFTLLAEIVGGVALILLMLVTVTDALMRSVLNRPVLGGSDLIQVMLVVVVACAIPICVAAGRAIAIEVLVRLLPDNAARSLHRVVAGAGAGALGYLALRCFVNGREAAMFGETTMLLQIPFGPFYLALALSFAVSAMLLVVEILRGEKLG